MIQQEIPYTPKFVYIYIDNSNLWIQGKKTHAKRIPESSITTNTSWRFDVGKLRDVIIRNSGLHPSWEIYRHKTTLYGSIPPPNDSVWEAIRSHDVQVKIFPRSQHNNREKQVDGQLITDAVKKAGKSNYMGQECEFIIVSGDLDFKPAVLEIAKCGFRVHVWSWKSGMAGEYVQLLHAGTKTGLVRAHCLDTYLDVITLGKPGNPVPCKNSELCGFVLLNPAPMMDKVMWYLSALQARVMFKRYIARLQWQPARNFDIVVIPERIVNVGGWHSLFVEVETTLNAFGLIVITFSQYADLHRHTSVSRAASGGSAIHLLWTTPALISNEYKNLNGPYHTNVPLADIIPKAEINHAAHHRETQTSTGWFNGTSRHPTTTCPWRTRSTAKTPLFQHEILGAKMNNGRQQVRGKKSCPFGKACMKGDKCTYSHS